MREDLIIILFSLITVPSEMVQINKNNTNNNKKIIPIII